MTEYYPFIDRRNSSSVQVEVSAGAGDKPILNQVSMNIEEEHTLIKPWAASECVY